MESVIAVFENKNFAGSIFCDLSKAFDCVQHAILVDKLIKYGLNITAVNLIKSYLMGRDQITVYNGVTSSSTEVKYGVPQGSVLGPLLFIIYVNDLPTYVNDTSIVLFADDTTMINIDSDENILLQDMQLSQLKASEWFRANKLHLNETKTQIMFFSTRCLDHFDNTENVKALGVIMDPHLRWDQHVDYLCGKLSKTVYLIRNLMTELPQTVIKTVYFSLFQSVFSYAILTWGHSSHLCRIFSLQRRVMRIMSRLTFRQDVKEKFRELNILTVPSYYILKALMYVKHNINNYVMHSEIHEYDTRRKDQIFLDFTRLVKSRNAINYYGPIFFNKLPPNIKQLPESKFHFKIKQILLNGAYYSFDEFLSHVLY